MNMNYLSSTYHLFSRFYHANENDKLGKQGVRGDFDKLLSYYHYYQYYIHSLSLSLSLSWGSDCDKSDKMRKEMRKRAMQRGIEEYDSQSIDNQVRT